MSKLAAVWRASGLSEEERSDEMEVGRWMSPCAGESAAASWATIHALWAEQSECWLVGLAGK